MGEVRYQHNDQAIYAQILEQTDPMTCFEGGPIIHDAVLFKSACLAATQAVPMTVSSLNNRTREREIRQRLLEALEYRDRWYRKHLPASGAGH